MSDDLERRLREALHAYADRVDAPADESLPARPAAPRRVVRRWRGAVLAAAAAAAVVIGSLVVVNVRAGDSPSAAGTAVSGSGQMPAESPQSDSATAADQALSGEAASADGVSLPPSPEPGVAYAVYLYTHCGVRGLDIGGVWFAADPPLVEEGGHPPAGWGNPFQPGTVTMLSATEAVFADDAGHVVRLRADESARPPLCE